MQCTHAVSRTNIDTHARTGNTYIGFLNEVMTSHTQYMRTYFFFVVVPCLPACLPACLPVRLVRACVYVCM